MYIIIIIAQSVEKINYLRQKNRIFVDLYNFAKTGRAEIPNISRAHYDRIFRGIAQKSLTS